MECIMWAAEGHCIDYPSFMCVNCQKSCGNQCRRSIARLLSISEQQPQGTYDGIRNVFNWHENPCFSFQRQNEDHAEL
eukprot:TRINITY_DN16739_c0_g1_i1.p2 TRINITY_DN16739_c0_g1~~TRINITY_DN16739_c0_g1_i1.p2  ORF type:complete len:78 (+),score=5.41 TRINITY_DN16739_c0_g1_i1:653-886(+)